MQSTSCPSSTKAASETKERIGVTLTGCTNWNSWLYALEGKAKQLKVWETYWKQAPSQLCESESEQRRKAVVLITKNVDERNMRTLFSIEQDP